MGLSGEHLANGVGLRLSLPLAISMRIASESIGIAGVGMDAGMASISSMDADGSRVVDCSGDGPACAESTDSRDQAMAVVDAGDDASSGLAGGDLGEGVGVRLSLCGDGDSQGNLIMKWLISAKPHVICQLVAGAKCPVQWTRSAGCPGQNAIRY